ncbi:MAG: hypothetical protein Q9196_000362 [Gyalolechia fulgens]
MCYHRNSASPLNDLVDIFGRLPVHTRQFVRHLITLPAALPHARNTAGNIVFFGSALSDINVHVHEAAHSLDFLNAYEEKPLCSSAKWISEYNLDSAVPDPYAQVDQPENVAQMTVITTYERNVPGGFFGLNPDASRIFRQYATLDTQQREAGALLVRGGSCTSRLANSDPVRISGLATRMAAKLPDVALPADIDVIPNVDFDTNSTCDFSKIVQRSLSKIKEIHT